MGLFGPVIGNDMQIKSSFILSFLVKYIIYLAVFTTVFWLLFWLLGTEVSPTIFAIGSITGLITFAIDQWYRK